MHLKRLLAGITATTVSLGLLLSTASIADAASTPVATVTSVTTRINAPVSDSDKALYETDDAEIVAMLNEMASQFKYYSTNGSYDDLISAMEDRGWSSYLNCVAKGVARSFGLDILKEVFTDEVRGLLKSRQWKVVSSVIHRNLSKKLGKKGASWVIKKMATKFLPGGLPGTIAFQAAVCGLKEIF